MSRTITARVVLSLEIVVSDDARNFEGNPLTDEEAVAIALDTLSVIGDPETTGLNPHWPDDEATFGKLSAVAHVVESEVTS